MRAFIIRHGQTAWNKIHRWQGHIDIPLDETGIKQATLLGEKLVSLNIKKIYSSPLSRAYKTALIIQNHLNAEIFINDMLREIDMGDWAGQSLPEMKNTYGSLYDKWYTEENALVGYGVENISSLQSRAFEALSTICENERGDVLIVTHGTLISTLICKLLYIPLSKRDCFEISNTGISIVDYDNVNRKFTVASLNAILA